MDVGNDGEEPGERVMELLERRTEEMSGEFNSQNVDQLQVWSSFTEDFVFFASPRIGIWNVSIIHSKTTQICR